MFQEKRLHPGVSPFLWLLLGFCLVFFCFPFKPTPPEQTNKQTNNEKTSRKVCSQPKASPTFLRCTSPRLPCAAAWQSLGAPDFLALRDGQKDFSDLPCLEAPHQNKSVSGGSGRGDVGGGGVGESGGLEKTA